MATKDTFSMKELGEALQCPICLLIPQSTPIYQCENGHVICKVCREKISRCPSCRQPLGRIRCMFAERMLEKVPIPCQFAVHGCEVKLQMRYQSGHASECQFREVQCPVRDCNSKTPIGNMMNHILLDHHGVENTLVENLHESHALITEKDFCEDGDVGYIIFLKHDGHYFFLEQHRIHSQGIFFFWIYFLGSSMEANKYTCKIKICSEDQRENYIYSGPPISIDVPFKNAFECKQGLVFADVIAQRLLKNDCLKFKIQIKTMRPWL